MGKPRDIGTRAETAVARYLAASGWPHAERRALRGTQDAGDITGTPGLCWQVKGGDAARHASDLDIQTWLTEAGRQAAAAGAEHGLLVLQRARVAPRNAGRWWAVTRLATLQRLVGAPPPYRDHGYCRMLLATACYVLRQAGYGTPIDHEGPTAPRAGAEL